MFSTLTRRLVALFVLTLLTSQSLVLLFFFRKADERIDDFNEIRQFEEIAHTYNSISELPREDQERLLSLIARPGLDYSIDNEPATRSRVEDKRLTRVFERELGEVEYYGEEPDNEVWSAWRIWFLDRSEANSDRDHAQGRVFSIRDKNGHWINARAEITPNELLVLTPVLISSFLTLALVCLVTILAVGRLTKPLRELSQAVEQMGTGRQSEALRLAGPEDVRVLSDTFNTMRERLNRFVDDRTEMLAAISHDLRTPLASLRVRVEFVDDAELRSALIHTLSEMERMLEATIEFARNERQSEDLAEVDMIEMLTQLAGEFESTSFEPKLPSYKYRCREVDLRRAVRNILDNAVKYGREARLELVASSQSISILVLDNGPGIPEDMHDAVFEPFLRLDKARNLGEGSVGLGLSIARTIVHRHGGTISFANRPDGLTTSIELPL